MKKLLALIAVSVTALFCAATASAGSYTSYYSCGTGAYVIVIQWDCPYCQNYVAARYMVWGYCPGI